MEVSPWQGTDIRIDVADDITPSQSATMLNENAAREDGSSLLVSISTWETTPSTN